MFKASGKVFREQDELFTEIAWQQVMIGQNLIPQDYHPIANSLSDEQVNDLMQSLKTLINRSVDSLPSHEDFLEMNI